MVVLAPVDPRFVDPKDPKLLVSLTTRAHSGQSPRKCESLSLGIHLDSPEDLDNAMKELTEKGVVFTGVVSSC